MDFDSERKILFDRLGAEVHDRRVLSAMRRVPREKFVPQDKLQHAYDDSPLPIGYGQTISQPMIVAIMTEALELQGNETVLEIGTGSGYQTAILAELAREIITTERISELRESAKETLARLGYSNVLFFPAAESLGYPKKAPYHAILAAAGAPAIPPELTDQLAPGGRLVIPVGPRSVQQLYKITRSVNGDIIKKLGGCRFVPLIGKGAWKE